MQITELHPPINGGTLFSGIAVSTRGRRWSFCATIDGEACGVQRADPLYDVPGYTFWLSVRVPPAALRSAVRKAVAS